MEKLHIMVIGAHPDDPDYCGGLALRMIRKGHKVTYVSVTDGGAGHHEMNEKDLIERRAGECRAVAQKMGVEYHILPNPDARLEVNLTTRAMVMKEIREGNPDIIITHRCCDYHPDHRATGQLVMDCAYMVGVPLYCPEIPAMRKNPVILSMMDSFTHPEPFKADFCVPIDDVVEQRIEGSLCHVSQYYEWLPWIDHNEPVLNAATFEEKTAILKEQHRNRPRRAVERFPELVPEGCAFAEAYAATEYGAPLTKELIEELVSP